MDTAVHDRAREAPRPDGVAAIDFRGDHFTLFGLPRRFDIDTEALSQAWRRMQALVHPDRFAGAGAAQARLAMQWSTLVNTAYRTLQDPLSRAAYLCELRGAPIDAERNTAMPREFLDQQMQWREQLDEARDSGDARQLQQLGRQVEQHRAGLLRELARLLDSDPADASAARQAACEVRVLMFLDKFRRDLGPRSTH